MMCPAGSCVVQPTWPELQRWHCRTVMRMTSTKSFCPLESDFRLASEVQCCYYCEEKTRKHAASTVYRREELAVTIASIGYKLLPLASVAE